MKQKPENAYIAFDVFPSAKGSATHINHCLKALQKTFKAGLLICLGNDEMPSFQFDQERNLYVYRWKEKVVNFLERTEKFQSSVFRILNQTICDEIKLIHFRDIWGGIPILKFKTSQKIIFEINAFSHIELPVRYPNISHNVIDKLKLLEKQCVEKSDIVITPSYVTKSYILEQIINLEPRIKVIPNGVQQYNTGMHKTKDPTTIDKPYILYFGALQKWQGIKVLLKALKELKDLDIKLHICSSVSEKRTNLYQELANAYGVNEMINWFFELDKNNLAKQVENALLTVAPLISCNRNLIQGCCPLKILESMAYGTPVVASELPVVKDIIRNNDTGFMIPPDRPELLGRKIRKLINSKEDLINIGLNGKNEVEKKYLWKHQEEKMRRVYKSLMNI